MTPLTIGLSEFGECVGGGRSLRDGMAGCVAPILLNKAVEGMDGV